MSAVTKTTVYLNEADYRRLKAIAEDQGRTPAELVRAAVAEYANRHERKRKPRTIGLGHSGRHDLSERAEVLLAGMGRKK